MKLYNTSLSVTDSDVNCWVAGDYWKSQIWPNFWAGKHLSQRLLFYMVLTSDYKTLKECESYQNFWVDGHFNETLIFQVLALFEHIFIFGSNSNFWLDTEYAWFEFLARLEFLLDMLMRMRKQQPSFFFTLDIKFGEKLIWKHRSFMVKEIRLKRELTSERSPN